MTRATTLLLTFPTLTLLAAQKAPTLADAQKFIADAESSLLALNVDSARAAWVKSTYITDDTEILAAKADEHAIQAQVELAKRATRFDRLKLPEEIARKIKLLKLSLTLVTPSDPALSAELTRIASG